MITKYVYILVINTKQELDLYCTYFTFSRYSMSKETLYSFEYPFYLRYFEDKSVPSSNYYMRGVYPIDGFKVIFIDCKEFIENNIEVFL